jgi:hypothetical protein
MGAHMDGTIRVARETRNPHLGTAIYVKVPYNEDKLLSFDMSTYGVIWANSDGTFQTEPRPIYQDAFEGLEQATGELSEEEWANVYELLLSR